MEAVNWSALSWAIAAYQRRGFTYIDTPWIVPDKSCLVTCPSEEYLIKPNAYSSLVGSSEQGFLHLDHSGSLAPGRYVSCTPCFRSEELQSNLHRPYFMKVELYVNDGSLDMTYLTYVAKNVMQTLAGDTSVVERATEDGYDLEIAGIEVGSYGARTSHMPHRPKSEISWVYGTGLAEPRFSEALAKARTSGTHHGATAARS